MSTYKPSQSKQAIFYFCASLTLSSPEPCFPLVTSQAWWNLYWCCLKGLKLIHSSWRHGPEWISAALVQGVPLKLDPTWAWLILLRRSCAVGYALLWPYTVPDAIAWFTDPQKLNYVLQWCQTTQLQLWLVGLFATPFDWENAGRRSSKSCTFVWLFPVSITVLWNYGGHLMPTWC